MRKFKYRLVVFVLGIIGAVILFHKVASPTPGTIPYHLQKLGRLRESTAWKLGPSEQRPDSTGRPVPANVRAYANPKTWLWFLKGRPTITSQFKEMEEQQQALIRLGYFERREFPLNHLALDPQLWGRFLSAVSNSSFAESRYMLHLDDSRPLVVQVTTCKADLPIFERIAAQLDKQTNR